MRPLQPAYHPFKWRGFWDFGTGALGDMACHTLNMPFMGLTLKDPLSVQALTAGHKGYMYPAWSVITFEFPALGDRGPVQLKWYDGGKKARRELFKGYAISGSGVLVVGEKGTLYAPETMPKPRLRSQQGRGQGSQQDQVPHPRRRSSQGGLGQVARPFREWVRAIKVARPPLQLRRTTPAR